MKKLYFIYPKDIVAIWINGKRTFFSIDQKLVRTTKTNICRLLGGRD
jgi:hypothetical protein